MEVNKTTIKWTYTPENAFKKTYNFETENFTLYIEQGKATITLTSNQEHLNELERLKIESFVRLAFRSLETKIHQKIKINPSVLCQYDKNGTPQEFIFISPVKLDDSSHFSVVDYQIKEQNGNIIFDSQSEGIKEEEKQTLEHHTFITDVLKLARKDPLLELLLNSYSNAINDPSDEFLHLYEVREALNRSFDNKDKRQKKLGISKENWNRFGDIINNRPVEPSRHRGNYDLTQLRPATTEELNEVRRIARQMIEVYIAHLKTSNESAIKAKE